MVENKEIFDGVIGGRPIPKSLVKENLTAKKKQKSVSGLDRKIIRLISLHPELNSFIHYNLDRMEAYEKRNLISQMHQVLGIKPLIETGVSSHILERISTFRDIKFPTNHPLATNNWVVQFNDFVIIKVSSSPFALEKQNLTIANMVNYIIKSVRRFINNLVRENKVIMNLFSYQVDSNPLQEIPVTTRALNSFVKKAQDFSQLTIPLRIHNLQFDSTPSVLSLEKEVFIQSPKMLSKELSDNEKILIESKTLKRIPHAKNEIIVASFIENEQIDTKILFVRLIDRMILEDNPREK